MVKPSRISPPLPRKQSFNILVVEDDESLLEFLCASLEAQGYRAHPAKNVEQAMEVLEMDFPISLVIADIHLPKTCGITFSEAMRDVPEFEDIPFIFISATSDFSGSIQKGDFFMRKPIDLKVILNFVSEIYDSSDMSLSAS